MSKKLKIINLTVFCLWIALISILLYKNYIDTGVDRSQLLKDSFNIKTHWYDIYKGPVKVGFAKTTIKKAGDEIIIKHDRETKIKRKDKEILLIEKLTVLCDLFYSIKSFEFSSYYKGEKGLKVRGNVDKDSIIFFLESPEKRKTHKTLTGGKDFYLPLTFIPVMHKKNLVPNKLFLIPMLDFINLSIDNVTVILEEIRPVKIGIHASNIYRFRAGDSMIWSNEQGMIIKEVSPSGITLYSQAKDIAKDPSERVLFDYTSLPYMKSNKILPDTETLTHLKLKISGVTLDPGLYKDSTVSLDNNILKIEKTDTEKLKAGTYALPYNKDDLGKYLKPDKWVMSEHKTVLDNAHNMVILEKNDAFRMARYLTSNLYFTVNSIPTFILSDSLEIFDTRIGDYLGRSVMFASFARASGLPTRLIGGLVYFDGFFYFHTWPEAWLGQWIPVDPSLAQFPADVTHIPIKEGTLHEITSIVDGLKNIRVEILEAS